MSFGKEFSENRPQIYSVKDLQQLLCVSHNTAYALVRSGQIRSIRIGRIYKIPKEAVDEFLRKTSFK